MLGEMLEQMRQNYSDYSAEALSAEWNRRKLVQDFTFDRLDRGEAMMAKAFEILIEEKRGK